MKRSLSIALALSFSTFAWSQSTSTPQGARSGELKVRGPEATAEQEPNKVVATIAGQPITARQAADMLKDVSAEQRRSAPSLASLVQQVYMVQKFADKAAEMHLDQKQPWKQELEATRANILGNAYLNYLSSTSSTPVETPQQYYDSHASEFEQIKLSGIFVAFAAPGANAPAGITRTEDQARTKAADIQKKLKGGASFTSLASSESDNKPSAAKGGEIGTVNLAETNLPANIKAVIANLQPGQSSDPVKVSNGFYIFKVDSKSKLSFDQSKAAIAQKIQTDRNQAVLKEQFANYKIEVNDPDFFSNGSAAPKIPSLMRPPTPGTPRSPAH